MMLLKSKTTVLESNKSIHGTTTLRYNYYYINLYYISYPNTVHLTGYHGDTVHLWSRVKTRCHSPDGFI